MKMTRRASRRGFIALASGALATLADLVPSFGQRHAAGREPARDTVTHDPSADSNFARSWTYDELGRLVSVTERGSAVTTTFTYLE
jgi:YD repeat-containing protein